MGSLLYFILLSNISDSTEDVFTVIFS